MRNNHPVYKATLTSTCPGYHLGITFCSNERCSGTSKHMHTKLGTRLRMDVECPVSKSGHGIRSGRVQTFKDKMVPSGSCKGPYRLQANCSSFMNGGAYEHETWLTPPLGCWESFVQIWAQDSDGKREFLSSKIGDCSRP